MVDEARKTNAVRDAMFAERFFAGSVIDIGCGPDLVAPHAVPFDLQHGDAQAVLNHFAPASFDCVHSSHCLEHMTNVQAALDGWWALVKPGGHLVVVVPEEDLYEQGAWPSLFNADHKATFRLFRETTWSPASYDIGALIRALPGADILQAAVHDQSYDRGRLRMISKPERILFTIAARRETVTRYLMRRGLPVYRVHRALDAAERLLGKPVDQTRGPALAQIEIIARKQPVWH